MVFIFARVQCKVPALRKAEAEPFMFKHWDGQTSFPHAAAGK